SGSSDPDESDSVASYRFDFGDGSNAVTQAIPTISHTYQNAGDYQPTLTVTDTRGAESQNAAFAVIEVQASFEDDDSHLGYDSGWHTVRDADASAGHFRLLSSQGGQHGLSFTFDLGSSPGNLQYFFATSSKGGSADVYIDGQFVRTVSYAGGSGSMHDPVFGASAEFGVSGQGSHSFELRNVSGAAYVDQLRIAGASSDAEPATAPGSTATNTSTLAVGQQALANLTVPSNAESLAVVAESGAGTAYKLVVLDPAGNLVGTTDASRDGIASVLVPNVVPGAYAIQLVNLGLGPLEIWSAATPQVKR
ncbi:MAG TPA: PKD domain-containing protein, partial [Woeseiaceae bacterium]|nr:PKD domain-containing protein [Woeseiaceae bacterium]